MKSTLLLLLNNIQYDYDEIVPPLKNKKHEQFVRNVLIKPSATQAYQETFKCSYDNARAHSHRLVANGGVQNRLLEVLNEAGLDEIRIKDKFDQLLEAKKESVQLGTLRTILEVRKDIETSSKLGLQVNIDTEKRAAIVNLISKLASS